MHTKIIAGQTPSIILTNPKYIQNVAGVVRAASCFGFKQVWYTGDRVSLEEGTRLPRELRMKRYSEVMLYQNNYCFDHFEDDVIPVAIEVGTDSESLPDFVHPEKAVYVFGPEDGSINQVARRFCHRFVSIPTRHCTNLSVAVNLVMYDRMVKRGEKHEPYEEGYWQYDE